MEHSKSRKEIRGLGTKNAIAMLNITKNPITNSHQRHIIIAHVSFGLWFDFGRWLRFLFDRNRFRLDFSFRLRLIAPWSIAAGRLVLKINEHTIINCELTTQVHLVSVHVMVRYHDVLTSYAVFRLKRHYISFQNTGYSENQLKVIAAI